MQQRDRDYIAAQIGAANRIIADMTPDDFLSQMSLESYRDDLIAHLAAMDAARDRLTGALAAWGEAYTPTAGAQRDQDPVDQDPA